MITFAGNVFPGGNKEYGEVPTAKAHAIAVLWM